MNNKFLVIVIGLIVIGFIGLGLSGSGGSSNPYTLQYETDTLNIKEQDRFLSKAEGAEVTLIEYSDFQCPACLAFYPIVSELKEDYKEDVNFVFRHYPLTSIHPKAMAAHRIAEASQAQGKFSEVHDLLFEQNQIWVNSSNVFDVIYGILESSDIDINIGQLKDDSALAATGDVISAHLKSGSSIGVNATPTFFLNGEKVQPSSAEEFRTLIDAALEKSAN